MQFLHFGADASEPRLHADLSQARLLELLDDEATDHAMVAADLALVVGESSLLRPGRPFLEIGSLIPGRPPELVRAPAALVCVDAELGLRDLGEHPGGLAAVQAHVAESLRWWWPVRIDGTVYLRSAGGADVRRHPTLAYAAFEEEDFVEQVAKNP